MVVFKIIALDLLVIRHCRVNCIRVHCLAGKTIQPNWKLCIHIDTARSERHEGTTQRQDRTLAHLPMVPNGNSSLTARQTVDPNVTVI